MNIFANNISKKVTTCFKPIIFNKHHIHHFTTRGKFLLLKISKNNFSSSNNNSENTQYKKALNEIKEKLKKEGKVKIYDSKYTFNSEKLMIHGSLVFLIISSTTIVISSVSLWLKLINAFFVFIPSLLIQLEYFLNNTKFVKNIILHNNNKVQVTDMWNKNETIEIQNLSKASDDPRLKEFSQTLNHQTFIIFTNKIKKSIYHVPRDGVFWDEGVFHDIIEGKKVE
jgi:hypothetical protein